MYMHLGMGVIVPKSDIIGIFDLDNSSQSHLTRAFLTRAEKRGQVESAAEDLPKAFAVCAPQGEGEQKIWLSQLSSNTLARRSGDLGFESL